MSTLQRSQSILDECQKLEKKAEESTIKEKEEVLIQTLDKLFKIPGMFSPKKDLPKGTYSLIEKIRDQLANSQKERIRNGSAVYLLSGLYYKQGGSYKSWKERWFVVDDSGIHYYKDQKDWENGPVKGKHAQPQGTISFLDITVVKKCGALICQHVSSEDRPKKGSLCLHIETNLNRMYNIVGFEDSASVDQWKLTLESALKSYQLQKEARQWLKDNAKLKKLDNSEGDSDDEKHEETKSPNSKQHKKKKAEDEKVVEEQVDSDSKKKKKKEKDSDEKQKDNDEKVVEEQVDSDSKKKKKKEKDSENEKHKDNNDTEDSKKKKDKETKNSDDEKKKRKKKEKETKNSDNNEKSESINSPKKNEREGSESESTEQITAKKIDRTISFTSSTLRRKLRNLEEESIKKMAEQLLDQYEKEGLLKELLMALICEPDGPFGGPKLFLKTISSEEFEKFTAKQRLFNLDKEK